MKGMDVLHFNEMLKALKDSAVTEAERMHVIRVHDDLDVARSIAVHLFGDECSPDVVFAVYDRLTRRRRGEPPPF